MKRFSINRQRSVDKILLILSTSISSMFFNRFDSYYYSRPVAYRSYNTRLTKPEIIPHDDRESQEVLNFLKQQGFEPKNRGTLHRGILFEDYEIGKRQYNHNQFGVSDEYYIHQFKDTNDLTHWHPTGVHLVFKSFPEFMKKLNAIVEQRKKRF